jgi:preprotein translocase subunit SecG
LLLTLFAIVCFLLVIVVLLQKGRGGGIGAAFGGMGSAAFGTRTGDVFTWVTIVLTALFLLLAVGSVMAVRPPMRTVSEPVFVPAEGEIPDETPIKIVTQTEGAAIRYTLDDSTPNEKSKEFKGSIRVEPGTRIKAIATRTGWISSKVVEAFYGPVTSKPATGDEPETMPGTSKPASGPASVPASTPASAPVGAGAPK